MAYLFIEDEQMEIIKSSKERGQALIVIALSAVVLFGFVALAIDGTAKFSDQRHAQNAADTAAVAGALGLVNGQTSACGTREEWECKALLRAEDNGYDDLTNNEVWVFKCNEPTGNREGAPLNCGPYEGNPNYLSVIIRSRVNTTFARVLGFTQMTNLVQAVTYWNKRGPAYDGNLIVALNPNPCTGNGANGNIALGTSGGSGSEATINLTGGGAFVNSGGSGCGMEIMGCPEITVNGGSMSSTGNGNINLEVGSQTCQDKLTLPSPTYDQDPYPFPPEMPDEPGACSGSPQVPPNQTTLNPGYYTSFPPAKDAKGKKMSDNITLNPGIYCLDTDLSLTNGKSIIGSNVLIYLKTGNEFNIQGGTLTLSGRTEGDYQGYVIIVNSNFSGQTPNCIVNGSANATITGTIFAPYCDIEIDGGGKTTSLSAQIIGYTVKITGSQAVNLTYNASDNAESDPKVGLMR
jgi:Putative Flp pilus-assembly TadE/G-like